MSEGQNVHWVKVLHISLSGPGPVRSRQTALYSLYMRPTVDERIMIRHDGGFDDWVMPAIRRISKMMLVNAPLFTARRGDCSWERWTISPSTFFPPTILLLTTTNIRRPKQVTHRRNVCLRLYSIQTCVHIHCVTLTFAERNRLALSLSANNPLSAN